MKVLHFNFSLCRFKKKKIDVVPEVVAFSDQLQTKADYEVCVSVGLNLS